MKDEAIKFALKSLYFQIYFMPLLAILSLETAATAADAKRTLSYHLVFIMKPK